MTKEEMDTLMEVHKLCEKLPAAALAAIAKDVLGRLEGRREIKESEIQYASLDSLTDRDPDLWCDVGEE